jgi:hypothetical protein
VGATTPGEVEVGYIWPGRSSMKVEENRIQIGKAETTADEDEEQKQ